MVYLSVSEAIPIQKWYSFELENFRIWLHKMNLHPKMKHSYLVATPICEEKQIDFYKVDNNHWVKAGAALVLSLFQAQDGEQFYQIPFVRSDPNTGFSIVRLRLRGQGAKQLGLDIMDQRDKDQCGCRSCL